MSYQGKVLWVDLGSKEIKATSLPTDWRKDYLGGRALGVKILNDFLPPFVSPFSKDNLLIISTGPLTGTLAPASGRCTIESISPLTGLIGYSNSGGHFGPEFKRAGYDVLIIRGISSDPVYLYIEDDSVKLLSARYLWGKGLLETNRIIKETHGEGVKILGIGPAGENSVLYACVLNGEWDAAGRTGLGAVFGSKGLKAIVVKGSQDIRIRNPRSFFKKVVEAHQKIKSDRTYPDFSRFGTSMLVDIAQASGGLSSYNAQKGVFDGFENISSVSLHLKHYKNKKACWVCPLNCKNYVKVENPLYAMEGGGPEYETLVCLGSRVGVRDLEKIIYANYLCNDLGLDTISAGTSIAFLMEASQNGLIEEKLPWGDGDLVIELLRKTAFREGLGDFLADGVRRMKEKIPFSDSFALEVKGLELPAFDVRTGKGFALSEATANRGGDHLTALPNFELLSMEPRKGMEWFGNEECVDPYTEKGKVPMVLWHEYFSVIADSASVCKYTTFATYALLLRDIAELISYTTGEEVAESELFFIAERAFNLERLFNLKRGMNPQEDDQLPRRFIEEPLNEGPASGSTVHLKVMLDEYYKAHGWDENGVPTPETLRRLGLASL